MESPQFAGDTTANSISRQLYGTHINKTPSKSFFSESLSAPRVLSSVYSGQKFIQISFDHGLAQSPESQPCVLRRVQDSYVNVSQMLHLLVLLDIYTEEQVSAYLKNEILSSLQYNQAPMPLYNDFSAHEVPQIQGLWIPYDKAVSIAIRLDVYKLIKGLFLVDVHDYDKLPKAPASLLQQAPKRPSASEPDHEESPSKRRKVSSTALDLDGLVNPNHPYALPPLTFDEKDGAFVLEAKLKFSEIFKSDSKDSLSQDEIKSRFGLLLRSRLPSDLDVSLDSLGKTALHYASTLASNSLVSSFVLLQVCSPIRGDNKGETPLIATIQVTNAMEKGNFTELLGHWLHPSLWLYDNQHQSFLHHLVLAATKNGKSSKFYFLKILEWIITNPDKEKNLQKLTHTLVNSQEAQTGNTALHLAGENELGWFVFLLLELKADPSLPNSLGVKPTEFNCVNHVMELRKNYNNNPYSFTSVKNLLENLTGASESDEYLFLLVHTGMEALEKSEQYTVVGELESTDDMETTQRATIPNNEVASSSLLSTKIFRSIQDLLTSTNEEYKRIIHAKKVEINNLNKELREATVTTANNRFIARKITSKISQVDTMKLQMTNINDKLQMLQKDSQDVGDADQGAESEEGTQFDADEPFIIEAIYQKLANNEPVSSTAEVVASLPPSDILAARLQAYYEINESLQTELDNLRDYRMLTAKFKKVVSYCTGVDVNEVDELLDGLLEAVEGQQ